MVKLWLKIKKPHISVRLFVTASGFKPETPSSVVRYSIQLSYAAIPLTELPVWGCKYNGKTTIFKTYLPNYLIS